MKNKKRLRKIVEGNKNLFIEGDVIYWSYNHYLNSKNFTRITKTGTFIRYIVSNYKDGGMRGTHEKFCFVHFKGNKNPSKVEKSQLEIIKPC